MELTICTDPHFRIDREMIEEYTGCSEYGVERVDWQSDRAALVERLKSSRVILALGKTACQILDVYGNAGEKWDLELTAVVLPVRAAYNAAELAMSLVRVPPLLSDYDNIRAVSEVVSEKSASTFPEAISFLSLAKTKDKMSCTLCGKRTKVGYYEHEKLKWRFCLSCANITLQWAEENEAVIREHAALAATDAERNKRYNAAKRVEDRIKKHWETF